MAKHAYSQFESSFMPKPKRSIGRTLGRIFGTLFALIIFAAVGLAVALTLTEYHPSATETLEVNGKALRTLSTNEEISILSWNIGYAALGDNADFFMDGGKSAISSTEERVKQNMDDIIAQAQQVDPDIALFQEVDMNSWRSYNMNEARMLANSLPNTQNTFSLNYKTIFVPFGIPPFGKIESGVETISKFPIESAKRLALPQSHNWPLSTVFLKRGQLVSRIPVEGSNHELVLINEHPDAYTNEEIHAKQIAAIVETMQEEAAKGNWVIAGGDWNHQFSNIDISAYPVLDENNWTATLLDINVFGEGWQFLMDNKAPTSRLLNKPIADEAGNPLDVDIQYYMIDGFIVSKNVRVESVETLDLHFKASDHNPVVIKVFLEKD